MLVVDELNNPAKYGLASMMRAGATIRFARASEGETTVVPEDLAVAATDRAETNNTASEKKLTLSVDLIPGSNRLVTTIASADNDAVVFHIPAWWPESEGNDAETETYV